MDSIGQRGRVDVEESHRSHAICVAGKQVRDVLAQLTVRWMSNHNAIDHHRHGRTIGGNHGRLRRQRPTKVHVVGAEDCAALSRRIDSAERLRGMRIVDRNRLGSKIHLAIRFVKCNRMQLVSAVAGRAGAAGIRQEVGEHLVAPARAVLIGISREHGLPHRVSHRRKIPRCR